MPVDSQRRVAHPELGTLADFEAWMARKLPELTPTRGVVTIPVVVHILHDGTAPGVGLNLSVARIQSQIDVLNEDFRRLNADAASTPVAFQPDAVDAEIEFCLATLDELGATMAEPGINRINKAAAPFGLPGVVSDVQMESIIKPATIWDPTQYFNIWVTPLSGSLLGYAQFPEASNLNGLPLGGSAPTDGVVMLTDAFGINPGFAPYGLGRTATHEVGHWLGLRHIWGDGDCNVDDYCQETPPAGAAHYGCAPATNTCFGLTQMVQNYMDYSNDACMNLFTADQRDRMWTVLQNSPRRRELLESDRCASPTTPTIYAKPQLLVVNEANATGADCNRTLDLTLTLGITDAPTGAAQVAITVNGGTATFGTDAEWIGGANTLTFPDAATGDQTLTLRILDDGEREGPETLDLLIALTNPGGTDAVVGSYAEEITVRIEDDEAVELETTLFFEDFEGTSFPGWNIVDFETGGSGNLWTITENSPLSGTSSAHISTVAGGLQTYDNTASSIIALATPFIDATGFEDITLEFLLRCNGEVDFDYGAIVYTLDDVDWYFASGVAYQGGGTNIFIDQLDLLTTMEATSFRLGFLWINDDLLGVDPPFVVDNVRVYANGQDVETVLNSNQTHRFGPNATIDYINPSTGDKMASLTNLSTYDYGCLDLTIDRAGTSVAEFWDNASPTNEFDLFAKTFLFTAENNSPAPGDQYELTLYLDGSEVNGWLAGTGNALSDIFMIKSPGPISNVSPANPYPDGLIEVVPPSAEGLFGDDYQVSGVFGGGFSGFGLGNPGTPPAIFPITYLSFEAQAEGQAARLDWVFESDLAVAHFDVQRSLDGESFVAVGRIVPAPGTAKGPQTFLDRELAQWAGQPVYYRIEGVDMGGSTYRSELRSVRLTPTEEDLWVYPQPMSDQLIVEANLPETTGQVTIRLSDLAGREVMVRALASQPGVNQWRLDVSQLSAGMYQLTLQSRGKQVVRRVVK